MTLSFTTKWPERMGALAGQPNYFIDKIWASNINYHNHLDCKGVLAGYMLVHSQEFGKIWDDIRESGKEPNEKRHTIRTGNRWREGMKIHPVINNRTKNRFQFAPTMVCTGVQEIEFKELNYYPANGYVHNLKTSFNHKGRVEEYSKIMAVFIDGQILYIDDVIDLALNDGFDTVEDFFAYFNTDFKGQIVHWTDLKY